MFCTSIKNITTPTESTPKIAKTKDIKDIIEDLEEVYLPNEFLCTIKKKATEKQLKDGKRKTNSLDSKFDAKGDLIPDDADELLMAQYLDKNPNRDFNDTK
ncbi:hypothetical protein ACO0QE_003520 [Hanseniaspora vineae]